MTANAEKIDRSSPIAYKFRLGTRLERIQEMLNALIADVQRVYLQNVFLLTAPVLVIKASSSPTVKSSGAFSALIAGAVQSKAADTDMSALVGTLATAKYAAWAFEMDSSGTITTRTKTADQATAAEAIAALPSTTANKVALGYIVVHNTSGSNFTGGTTALDAAGITVTYVPAAAVSDMTAEAVDELD